MDGGRTDGGSAGRAGDGRSAGRLGPREMVRAFGRHPRVWMELLGLVALLVLLLWAVGVLTPWHPLSNGATAGLLGGLGAYVPARLAALERRS